MRSPKLRDNKNRQANEPYNLGCIPEDIICNISKWIVYNFAVGKSDINGEDWGDIFAKAISGEHLNNHSHSCQYVRVISGRCSPDYSYGISDPHENVQATGTAVLGIWNERINIAKDKFEPLRSSLLIRNPNVLEFCLYEHELARYNTANYQWTENRNGNLIGIEKDTGKHIFTWQPHGSQFTIHYDIPTSATRFSIRRPPVLDFEKTMESIGFAEDWVTIL